MLKHLLLGLMLVSCISLSAKAQVFEGANVKALNTLYEKYDSQYQETRTKILEMANLPAWDRPDLSSNGMVFGVEKVLPNGYILVNEIDNNRDAANTTRASSLWTGGSLGLNLNGEGMTVGVWEAFDTAPNGGSVAAVLPTHVELNGRVTIRDGAALQGGAGANHGVHVAGTIAATGVSANAKGMASSALIDSYDANNDEAEMALAGANGMVISNHSYGFNAQTIADIFKGSYAINARDWDEIAFNAPNYVIVKSAGNNGPTGTQPATNTVFGTGWNVMTGSSASKNILVIGAANIIGLGYQQPSDVIIAGFSTRGPTDDGRIKPDVVGAGVSLYSSIGNTNNSYGFLSGTSMSAPNVAGSVALLQQHWRATLGGGTAWPRSATVRGLVIHTADEAGTTPGPDYIFGYGMVNVERAVRMVSSVQAADGRNVIQQNTLNNGGNLSLNVVASGREPLKVTICWNDPIPPTTILNQDNPTLNDYTSALVNDLDVRVTDVVTTNTSQPWVMPYQVNQANVNMALAINNTATTGDNTKDNVEQIVIANPVPGRTYTINITHKGTLATPQQYTLIASGVGGTAVAASGATDNTDSRIENVTLTGAGLNNSSSTAGACATYTDFTGLPALTAIATGQTVNLSVTLGTCNNAADKHVRVYIDWNGNGSFADAGEMVAQSAAAVNGTGLGISAASVTVPSSNILLGGTVLMRVVAVETTDVTTIAPTGTYTRGETEDYLIRISNFPGVDVGVAQIITSNNVSCGTTQSLQLVVRNFSNVVATNVPVDITFTGATPNTLSVTVPSVPALGQTFFNVTTPFSVPANASYTVSAATTLAGDAVATNNSATVSITVAATPSITAASSSSCGVVNPTDLISLQATVTGASSNSVVWYDAAAGGNRIAAGNQAYFTKAVADALPTANTVFAGLNDLNVSGVGPLNTLLGASATGGHAQAGVNPIFVVNSPFTIASARLYVSSTTTTSLAAGTGTVGASAGTITFTVTTPVGEIVSSSVVPVTYTGTTGAIFPVNIVFPRTGTFLLNIAYSSTAVQVFRNNGAVPAGLYPINVANVAQIIGSNANPGTIAAPNLAFYYWLYDMTITAIGCPTGSRQAVTINSTGVQTATITQGATASFCDTPGASVTLNATETGAGLTYRWQRRTGTNPFADIAGATAASFAATRQSATTLFNSELVDYRVIITRADGCQATSAITTVTCNPQPFDLKIGSVTTAPPTAKPNFATGSPIVITLAAYNGVASTNQTYEWFRNGVSLGAATLGGSTLAVTQAGTYTARVTGPCFTQTSAPFVVTDVTPTATATALACGTNPRQLNATATTGQVFWYDAAVAGNLLAVGTSNTRPNTETVNPYFVGINDFSGLVSSPASNTNGGGSNINAIMFFNANMPLEIDSATINVTAVGAAPNNTITFTVFDRNFSTIIISQRTITVTAGINRYKIGLYVPYAGNNFGLQASTFGTGTLAYRQGVVGSVVFPYSIANVFSITGTDRADQTAFYYFLYNIRIQAGSGAPATSRVNVPVQLRNLPTATLSGGGQLPAGQGLDLSVALTGTAPWSLVYNNGTANVSVANISSSPFIISTNTAGTFTLVSVSDASGCGSGTVSGTALVTPAAPLVTSIDDAILAGVKVYPNPTNDVVNIEYYDAAKQVTATLVNANGATFGQLPLVNNGAFWSGILDLASLPSGVYYIQLNNGQELKVRAVIKP